ncbi:hypothetical protein DPMN_187945 [Dreissena polymorpha]|uniref:Uncharacterized protein n=1 Tax=Dreissena polymorpha TaxID=45954 RepID=A0A9D4I9H9_DREPO|nr:hypothetical protein DPMN_187945 [Dreissena polymorpha]
MKLFVYESRERHLSFVPTPPRAPNRGSNREKCSIIHPRASRDNRSVIDRPRRPTDPIRSHHRLFPPTFSQTVRPRTKQESGKHAPLKLLFILL